MVSKQKKPFFFCYAFYSICFFFDLSHPFHLQSQLQTTEIDTLLSMKISTDNDSDEDRRTPGRTSRPGFSLHLRRFRVGDTSLSPSSSSFCNSLTIATRIKRRNFQKALSVSLKILVLKLFRNL
ncbi:hypothetical protein L2E82_45941 [Cichorium intybus]|uniref:Uncharacterized protein n=1 Tax=Cichorium intybus TaxID=13427 RepID=A0ACB8ZUW0_CICIN|nr:hypothetical protein L2E82_45941 [Cichorium intybus]